MLNEYIKNYIEDLKAKNLYRELKNSDSCMAAEDSEVIDDMSSFFRRQSYLNKTKGYLNFSGNDYLGLSDNKESLAAGCKAAEIYGSGSTGSRLLSGNAKIFEEFEKQIATDKNFESSLIVNSGFIANSGVISALCIPNTLFIFDKLNHASMYCGIDSGSAGLARYKHRDYDALENLLKKYKDRKNKIIASETVFGMDGDIADVEALSFLSQKYEVPLFLDEAHATGLYGKNGYGVSTDFELNTSLTIVMGTFSKALSSSGAYVACSELMKNYLINKCKGFVYSTALSPFCIGIAARNWSLLKTLEETRRRILKLSEIFRREAIAAGHRVPGAGTNIIPIVFNDIDEMSATDLKLKKHGITASPVRPPTSPTPRIRFAVNATHGEEDIYRTLEILKK
ncbi:MAG: aminotransferase class I/II-fold pyridoxal phosphate-dependent enzyme [Holosporaceae bacterium]|nr:aminotransferase class I/II-fold pyridoxal phosphate-dependent enzyme [Holosporaceae bacterium]